MKVGLYSPFVTKTGGGGERYFLMVAECLLQAGCQVDFILPQDAFTSVAQKQSLKKKYNQVFHLELAGLEFINGPFGSQGNFIDHWQFTSRYDAFYYLTDGSFFISAAKLNVVHFMIPFSRATGYFNKLKLLLWPIKVSNSHFTKKVLEKHWGIKINFVHGGVVDLEALAPLPKKKVILNVGRFMSSQDNKHCKRQDVLVEAFKKMCDQGLTGWHLRLIGPVNPGQDNQAYADQVKQAARGYPIAIEHDLPFSGLKQAYGTAKIYWHATGYGLDEDQYPEAMEHLGITTIEAMAAQAVPVVINKAGQKEIVTDEKNGLLWETEAELIKKTKQVIRHETLRRRLALSARRRAQDFSQENFCQATKIMFGIRQ